MLEYALLSAFIVSLISFIGIFFIVMKTKELDKILLYLVSFAAGGLMGGAFLHLLPESISEFGVGVLIYALVGFCLFFIIEKVLHWHHCHKGKCEVHMFTYMNLIGDGVHNFVDGLIIAGSFIMGLHIGIVSTVAIILHEIPQEIGDFGILVYGGFSKFKALFFNFLSGLTAILGVFAGYFISEYVVFFNEFLLAFAAGGFIYIATVDLVPELHKELNLKKSLINFILFLFGISFMWILKFIF